MNKIGTNIKELRTMRELSQAELADKLNVSRKTVSHWENGYSEPSVDYIKLLKEILSVEYTDLLD